MNKNKYANYGKVIAGDDVISFGIERYMDLLQSAEKSRQIAFQLPDSVKQKQSPWTTVWQFIANLI